MFFFITFHVILLAVGVYLSWGLPSHSSRSRSSQAAYMDHWLRCWLHWQYWLKNHWP